MARYDSPLGSVELTDERWHHIVEFHPEIKRYRSRLARLLTRPVLMRRSKTDGQVYLLYCDAKQYYLVVVVKVNHRKFVLTAYLTHKIKHLPV